MLFAAKYYTAFSIITPCMQYHYFLQAQAAPRSDRGGCRRFYASCLH